MFEISVKYTSESSNNLHRQSVELSYLLNETQVVASGLKALSCMEGVLSCLHSCIESLEEDVIIYRQVASALDKINYCYESSENRIVDNTEQGTRRYARKGVEVINFQNIRQFIEDGII